MFFMQISQIADDPEGRVTSGQVEKNLFLQTNHIQKHQMSKTIFEVRLKHLKVQLEIKLMSKFYQCLHNSSQL